MRYALLLSLALAVLSPDCAPAQTFQVKTSVNDVTNVREIASADLRPLPAQSYPGSHAAFRAVYEEAPDGTTTWAVTLFGYASDTTALSRASRVRIQADGAQLAPRRIESTTRSLDGTTLEIKRLFLSRSHFVQVARADSVTLSAGPVRFTTDRVRRTDLRLILETVSASPRQASQNQPVDTSATNDPSKE